MRIFIDCTHTARHTYKNTGIHRVVRELSSELLKINSTRADIDIVAVMFDGIFIRRVTNIHPDSPKHSVSQHKYFLPLIKIAKKLQFIFYKLRNRLINLVKYIPSPIINWLYLNYLSNKNSTIKFENYEILPGDIYIIADANWDLPKTYYKFLDLLKAQKVNIIVICYDLIPLKFPEFSSKKFAEAFLKFYSEYSVLFDQVLCISKNSVKDYQYAMQQGILANNKPDLIIKSFRLGSDYSNHDSGLNIDQENFGRNLIELVNKRYILVVGSLVPHKNIKGILAAFNLLLNSNYKDIYLLFAGNKGWHLETDTLIESDEMYGNLIHILGSVSDAQLKVLYQNCYCLVQASFYEGFGLPVVEALQYGKPVIASIGGSLPEVGGDFCLYFDPYQPVELYQALKKLLDSDIYYNLLLERIKNEYRPFSWAECAEQFLSDICI